MILETVRMVADALGHVTYGVNVQLASLNVDDGDSVPTDVSAIEDETRSGDVAVGRYPENVPCITVALDGQVELDGEVMSDNRDAEVSVVIRYVTSAIQAEQGLAATYYTLRAVQKALRAFNSNDNAADRIRNNIQVIECLRLDHVTLFQPIDDLVCTGAIRAMFKVRDTTP